MASTGREDYYVILNVAPTAGVDAIKAAYRRLALLKHPDKNKNSANSTADFQKILCAWETLRDPTKRKIYDLTRTSSSQRTYSSTWNWSSTQGSERPTPQPPDESAARRAWQTYARDQGIRIQTSKDKIKTAEEALDKKATLIAELAAKLSEPQSWFFFWSYQLSPEERAKLQNEKLQAEASVRIRKAELQRERDHLKSLEADYEQRETANTQRELREAAERQRRFEREQAERRRKDAEEQAERSRKYAEEQTERNRKYAEEQARRKAAEDVIKQVAAELRRRAAAQAQQKANYPAAESTRRPTPRQLCRHRDWWSQIAGQKCSNCGRFCKKFTLQCPGCRIIACHDCMNRLKARG